MSIDDQLRAAFVPEDETWTTRGPGALADVRRRHRRGVVVRRGAVGLAAAAVVTAVVLAAGGGLGDEATPDPAVPPSTETTDGVVDRTEVLDGRWRTELLDEGTIRSAMEAAGDEAFADEVLAALPAPPLRLVWLVDGAGIAQLRVAGAAGSEVLDEQAISVTGDDVELSPRFAEGSSLHRMTLVGDDLGMAFVSSTEGTTEGVPGAVWLRLLYDAFPFDRR